MPPAHRSWGISSALAAFPAPIPRCQLIPVGASTLGWCPGQRPAPAGADKGVQGGLVWPGRLFPAQPLMGSPRSVPMARRCKNLDSIKKTSQPSKLRCEKLQVDPEKLRVSCACSPSLPWLCGTARPRSALCRDISVGWRGNDPCAAPKRGDGLYKGLWNCVCGFLPKKSHFWCRDGGMAACRRSGGNSPRGRCSPGWSQGRGKLS